MDCFLTRVRSGKPMFSLFVNIFLIKTCFSKHITHSSVNFTIYFSQEPPKIWTYFSCEFRITFAINQFQKMPNLHLQIKIPKTKRFIWSFFQKIYLLYCMTLIDRYVIFPYLLNDLCISCYWHHIIFVGEKSR